MKLTDYVARFLAAQGIRHVFAITGGGAVHMVQSLHDAEGIDFVCMGHEQASSMAADAYSRTTGNLGAALSTSGPGGTNMLTGIAGAYYDSVPVLYLTGQVTTHVLRNTGRLRQLGFQQTAIVDMARPVTKYAAQVLDPLRIRFELEKSVHAAKSGRPGPVLLDLPDDVQRADIDPDSLEGFTPEAEPAGEKGLAAAAAECARLIEASKRPVLVLGWGVRVAGAEEEARRLARSSGIPTAMTWAVRDLLPSDDPVAVPAFGTHGTRAGNFTVQNADLVLAVGARLDAHSTGTDARTFARGARKVVVDIEAGELEKFKAAGMKVDLPVLGDAKAFLRLLAERTAGARSAGADEWLGRVRRWVEDYPVCPPACRREKGVNPYVFVDALSERCEPGETLLIDTGNNLGWMSSGFRFKEGQRMFHDFNHTSMGWALPASLGACFARGKKRVVCVTGDGSLQMNIQELATLIGNGLPVKLFVLDNRGYSMIRRTQDHWLGSRYLASSQEGGVSVPDFPAIAKAYGFKTASVSLNSEVAGAVREAFDADGPFFCRLEISPGHKLVPLTKYGRPIEDPEPLLPRDEFRRQMIVPPLEEKAEAR